MEKIEVPKELAEKIYKLIENTKIDGKLRKGANEVTKSIEKSEAKLVIIAADVQPEEIIMHMPVISKERGIPFVHVPSRAELGVAAGLPVATAAIVIVNPGELKKLFTEVLHAIELLKKGSAKPQEKPKVEAKPAEQPAQEKPKEAAKVKEKKEEPKAEEKPAPKEEAKPKPAEEKKEQPSKEEKAE